MSELQSPQPSRLFGWPGRDLVVRSTCLIATVGSAWLVLYHGADQLNQLHTWRVQVHHASELRLPFVPGWTLVYSSLYMMIFLAPFVLRNRQSIDRLAIVLFVETFVATIFFVTFPAEVGYPRPQTDQLGVWAVPFTAADFANGTTNCLPSLHVAYATTCGWILSKRSHSLIFTVWAGAIAVSTILTHQHHVLDVVLGGLLAVACLRIEWKGAVRYLDGLENYAWSPRTKCLSSHAVGPKVHSTRSEIARNSS